MPYLNKVFLMGNLTRDPQIKYTPGGAAVANFGLAINKRYTTKQGDEREDVCFVEIEVWNKQAENCSDYLVRGSSILVEGNLRFSQWDDRETGKKRNKLFVRAESVKFLGKPQGAKEENGENRATNDSRPPLANKQPAPPPFEATPPPQTQEPSMPANSYNNDIGNSQDNIPF